MSAHISLSFGTTLNRVRTMRINNPLMSASDAAVRDAMTDLINSQTVSSLTSGRINSMRSASLVETLVTPIQLLSS